MKTTNRKKVTESYNTGIQSGFTFANTVIEVWNDELNNEITPADLTCDILTPIFAGVRNGTLYLAATGNGIAWAMIAGAFRGLAPMAEIKPGVRAAWKAAGHKDKLNSGYLGDFTDDGKRKSSKPGATGSNNATSTSDLSLDSIIWELKLAISKKVFTKKAAEKAIMEVFANL